MSQTVANLASEIIARTEELKDKASEYKATEVPIWVSMYADKIKSIAITITKLAQAT